jgi:uncharacterized membrane protein
MVISLLLVVVLFFLQESEPLGWRGFVLIVIGCLVLVMILSMLATRALKGNQSGKRKRNRH